MHLCLCDRGKITLTVCSATVGFMAVIIPSLSAAHGKGLPEGPHRVQPALFNCGTYCDILECNLQVFCHNKCWTVWGKT